MRCVRGFHFNHMLPDNVDLSNRSPLDTIVFFLRRYCRLDLVVIHMFPEFNSSEYPIIKRILVAELDDCHN